MSVNIIDLANEVIKSADIVEVISHYIKLEKKGRNYASLCPFHDDKSLGSFSVSREKGLFKCFSCNTGGNAITFVQKYTNCSFAEAVKKTAEIIGFKDDRFNEIGISKPIDPKLQRIYDCLNDIAGFYSASLFQAIDGKDALDYLHSRGLDDDIIKTFKIGYAQNNGENIINFLLKKGYSLETISQTGILSLNQTPYRDINHGRIAFTIQDKEEKTVGFSCRRFKEDQEDQAKYINTSATALFNKSNVLFNFYQASIEAKKVGYIYLLEGFMDVIACYRVGIKSAVGLMGTALTKENLQSLLYLKVEVRVCLDLDRPGQLNTLKAIELLEQYGIKHRIVNNNVSFSDKDTDEILKNNGEEVLRSYLTNLIGKLEWLFNYYSKMFKLNTLDGKKIFLTKLLPYIAAIEDPIDFEIYTNKIISLTGFTKDAILKFIKQYKKANNKKTNKEEFKDFEDDIEVNIRKENKTLSRLNLAERRLIGYILENNEALITYQEQLGYIVDTDYKSIISAIEEFRIQVGAQVDYNSKNLISFISDENVNLPDKNKLIWNITTIDYESQQLPPYKKDVVEELINTIKSEKEKHQNDAALKMKIEGETFEERLRRLNQQMAKKKIIIQKNDEDRR